MKDIEELIKEVDELLKDNEWDDLKHAFAEKLWNAGKEAGRQEIIELIESVRVEPPRSADERQAYEIKKMIVAEMKATFLQATKNL